MTPDERRAMRDLLRTAITTAVLPGATPDPPGGYRRADPAPDDSLAWFTAELTALGGAVHEPDAHDAGAVAALISSLVPTGATKRVLMWDDRCFPVPALGDALAAQGFVVVRQSGQGDMDGTGRELLAGCSVGVTAADALLVETGSVVLVAGQGRGRLASLLPPVHVVVAGRSQFVRSLPDLLVERPDLAVAGSNMVCITGPSRTADIEHTLSRGVHGPKEVHVVVV